VGLIVLRKGLNLLQSNR